MLAGTLVMVKCTVPALFVILSAAIAIPLDEVLTDMMRESTEQIAGGALIVTYAFELTKGYQLRMADGKGYDKWKVCMSMLGTVISAQLQTAAQGFFPWGFLHDQGDELDAGDAVPFAIAFFVDGVVLAYDAEPTEVVVVPAGASVRERIRIQWRRIRPCFSVLTLVVSIDNAVDGVGMYQHLDEDLMPRWIYYIGFVVVIYLGGVVTLLIRHVQSEGLQALWYAFGAFSILVGGMELADDGLTTSVLFGFILVWAILMLGDAGVDDDGTETV